MAHSRGEEAFTRLELVVVILVLAVVVIFVALLFRRAKHGSSPQMCLNNLKQIGIAYRIWSNDNGDHFPAETGLTNGGWRDLLASMNASSYCWTNYATMAY